MSDQTQALSILDQARVALDELPADVKSAEVDVMIDEKTISVVGAVKVNAEWQVAALWSHTRSDGNDTVGVRVRRVWR